MRMPLFRGGWKRHTASPTSKSTLPSTEETLAGNSMFRTRSVGGNTSLRRSRLFHASSTAYSSSGDEAVVEDDSGKRKLLCATRAKAAVDLLPTYLSDARAVQKYSPATPNGALQLSVAENQMLEDLLVPSLTEFSTQIPFPADAIYYQPTQGRASFRKAMAGYLQTLLFPDKKDLSLDVDGIIVGAGCNAVLENLCLTLAAPGEAVMIPCPYYAAFEFDLVARAGLSIVPVPTMKFHDLESTSRSIPENAYYPNRASLDAAMMRAKTELQTTPKILLLSHPQNPLGICYPPSVIQECIDWCRENEIHLISDEIYAGSVYRKTLDDSSTSPTFVSALELASSASSSSTPGIGLGPYIHLVYALSKDFALSGLRVGVSYSENPDIRLPLQKLNDLCCISSHTQLLVERMLTSGVTDASSSSSSSSSSTSSSGSHSRWSEQFLDKNQSRLLERSKVLTNCLDELDIPFLDATAGLFVWMDLSEFLPPSTSDNDADERERAMYLELLTEFGLLFTPGRSMKNELPGFFRCVFTAASQEEFDLTIERFRHYVHSKRGKK